MDDIKYIINYINKTYKLKFINDFLEKRINNTVFDMFPKLFIDDQKLLIKLTIFLVDIISFKNNFKKSNEYYSQWTQNNNRDIKSLILLLLPYIDDKNNNYLFKKLINLKQLLNSSNNNITHDILTKKRQEVIPTHFEFGTLGIGLLDDTKEILLDENLIYKIIEQNLMGLLQTLEIMNGKYYINWINIVPLNINNYINSSIYINTNNKLLELEKNIKDADKSLLSIMLDYNGLWLGDIYNILRKQYYENAKSIKWLIFVYETMTKKYYLINILNELISLNSILISKTNNYDNLDDEIKFKFKIEIKNTINILKKNIEPLYFEVIKYYLIYLINNDNTILENYIEDPDISKFKLINIDDDSTDEDFDPKIMKQINELTLSDIIKCLQKLYDNNIANLWNYLKSSLSYFKISVYGKFLITNNTILDKYYYEPFNNSIKETDIFNKEIKNKLNLKNIYNIAKTLSHNNLTSWQKLKENYLLLQSNEKINFFKNIYIQNTKYNSWINIQNNLKKQFLYKNTIYDYKIELIKIVNAFKYALIFIIFEELIFNGLLSSFMLNLEITNNNTKTLLINKNEWLNEWLDEWLDEWLESHYFLTNDLYKNLPNIRVEREKIINENDKYIERSYLDVIFSEQKWMLYYALDWISQINFFKHYIFHQIMYVTGATGQGKSTQVPKLLLYALKVIDYKNKNSIICTQPRITAVTDNAKRIAYEMGTPIDYLSNNSDTPIITNNFYIQYKYQNGNHNKNTPYFNYLNITTDGTLFNKIKSNIIFKNEHDIIIIDEVHEHNINMDLIITLAKQTCYFNKDIKLILISATMETDEPIYRRYFYNIEDPKYNLIINPFNETNFTFESKYMDRRYDITPPGKSTQYNIIEEYRPVEENNNLELYADNILEKSYEVILEICNNTSKGHILLFALGKTEIKKAIKKLNSIIPNDIIALPFFSEMAHEYKDKIAKIDSTIKFILNKKENIENEWDNIYIEDKTTPIVIYKRAIIIATNIAEASITIPNLMYVIDNGLAKINIYNVNLNKSDLKIQKISELNRIQRRGRIGRISDGVVYYLYKKDSLIDIKPNYKISSEDSKIQLLGLTLCENSKTTQHNKNYNKEEFNIFQIDIFNPLFDLSGLFYLIHPLEKFINRDILNNILNVEEILMNKYNLLLTHLLNQNLLIEKQNKYRITEFTKELLKNKSSDKLNEEINDTIIYYFAETMGCYKEVYSILKFIETFKNINFLKKNKNNSDSDLIIIYNIIKNMKESLPNLLIFNEEKFNNNLEVQSQSQTIYNKYKSFNNKHKDIPNKTWNSKIWNGLLLLDEQEDLKIENIVKLIKNQKNYKEIYNQDFEKNKTKIQEWCTIYNFKYDDILKFFKKLTSLFSHNYNWYKNLNININKFLTDNTIEEKIIRSFIYGYPTQIGFNNKSYNKTHFITLISGRKYTITNIKTLCDHNNYFFFFKYEINTDHDNDIDISIISNFKAEWIIPALPKLYNNEFDNIINSLDNNLEIINSPGLINFNKEIIHAMHPSLHLWDSMEVPILKEYYDNINKK